MFIFCEKSSIKSICQAHLHTFDQSVSELPGSVPIVEAHFHSQQSGEKMDSNGVNLAFGRNGPGSSLDGRRYERSSAYVADK